ncbi:SWR1 complex subunit 2 isoform X2 [Telopea speciosissima]|uniref:SWR1 complex subunit 2 isoform X2 n=1 Tax=Telopea speciosissima TaxID=54955 RepID=UPI001CC376C6|nr:SWR1 complex subunit 2 isoform X2 [Telopea speciosissima]
MATFHEEEPVILERSTRTSRGKRMTKLLDEEVEEDELFWNQDSLREEEDDENYKEEAEVADEFDSDFDEDEPEPDDEVENDANDRVQTKKRLIYPGKSVTKKKNKKKVLSKLERAPEDESSHKHHENLSEHHDIPDDPEGERIVRKSMRTSVIVRQAERDAIRAALQATMKPIKRRKEGEEKRMTQEEMLLEAAQTEIMNLRNLERVLAREEEVKKRAVVHKTFYSGPQIRYSSRNGQVFLEFSKGLSFLSESCTTSALYPQRAICAVTGLPANYSEENNRVKGETKDMGVLFDSISGQGFSGRRKRSVIEKTNEAAYMRYWARFRSIPALEIQDLD